MHAVVENDPQYFDDDSEEEIALMLAMDEFDLLQVQAQSDRPFKVRKTASGKIFYSK
jgi:hypothetical protein